jgi:uncharacterized protein YcfJ
MSKSLIAAILLGLATGAQAQSYYSQPPPQPTQASAQVANVHFGWAEVLRVDPIYAAVAQPPPEQCYPRTVTRQDHDHSGGTVLGAIVGGVLGNTIGKGDGRTAATVAGAVAGGAIGSRISAANDQTYTAQQTVCRPAGGYYAPQQQIVAYDVEYRYHGEIYMSRLSFDPGERLRVRVAVTPAE